MTFITKASITIDDNSSTKSTYERAINGVAIGSWVGGGCREWKEAVGADNHRENHWCTE